MKHTNPYTNVSTQERKIHQERAVLNKFKIESIEKLFTQIIDNCLNDCVGIALKQYQSLNASNQRIFRRTVEASNHNHLISKVLKF